MLIYLEVILNINDKYHNCTLFICLNTVIIFNIFSFISTNFDLFNCISIIKFIHIFNFLYEKIYVE